MDTNDPSVVNRYNRAAERRFVAAGESAELMAIERRRPLGSLAEAPQLYYKFGIMLGALGLHEGERVLDFGCGAGWIARALNYMGVEAVGLNVSQAETDLARDVAARDELVRKDVSLEFVTYDGFVFPFESSAFDAIVCFDAFHHVPNKRQVLGECSRVLRDGGRMTFVEPGGHHHESEQANREAQTYGILEDSVSLRQLIDLAGKCGLGDPAIAPYPPQDRLSFGVAELRTFLAGDDRPYKLDAVRRDLDYAFILTVRRGGAAAKRKAWWQFWR